MYGASRQNRHLPMVAILPFPLAGGEELLETEGESYVGWLGLSEAGEQRRD